MPENLEIKSKASNLSELETIARKLGRCVFSGVQRDTYFRVTKGRLKLRETTRCSELIFYERPNQARARWSIYTTARVEEPAKVKSILQRILGVARVVTKHRKVYIYGDARIHLDRVRGLGNFIEIEVVRRGTRQQARELMKSLCTTFGLDGKVPSSGSYSDLVA